MTFWPALGSYKYPQRPKKALLGALEVLGGPWRSLEGPKGPNLVLTVTTGWSKWVGNIYIMCSGPFRDLYGTPGAPRRTYFVPIPSVSWPHFGKKNWLEYRQVGCPERRNGMPCLYSTITCHMEPCRWTKLPKT